MTRALGISKEIEDAAWFVLGPGLHGRASPLDGRTRTWSVPAATELLDRLERGTADPKAPMMTNLRDNLEGATRGAKQLAVELLFLQSLPLAHEVKSLKVKRARVAEAAGWLEPPLELPDELYAGMTDHGVLRDRTAEFNWTIWDHLKWLCRFVRNVAQRPAAVVQAAVKDPLQFHRLAASTPDDQPAIRRSIEFLAWPSYFEPVVADVERQEIRDAFASLVGGAKGTPKRTSPPTSTASGCTWTSRRASVSIGTPASWSASGGRWGSRAAGLAAPDAQRPRRVALRLARRGKGDPRRRTSPPPGPRRQRRSGPARR